MGRPGANGAGHTPASVSLAPQGPGEVYPFISIISVSVHSSNEDGNKNLARGLRNLSKTKLRELLLKGHLTYEDYIAEIHRLEGLREKLYDLYLAGHISRDDLTTLLAELDRKEDDLPDPPTVY